LNTEWARSETKNLSGSHHQRGKPAKMESRQKKLANVQIKDIVPVLELLPAFWKSNFINN